MGKVLVAADRIAAAPITWGVCEVPGWGVMLPPERVLAEMREVGVRATEVGAPGFFPDDPAAVRDLAGHFGIEVIGGFVPVVLHDPAERQATLAQSRATASRFAAMGASYFVSAVVVDEGWSTPFELSAAQWDHLIAMLAELDGVCADAGLTQVLHPHVGTLVEQAADVRTVLERSPVRWCLDTGHLAIGGYDPKEFAADAAGRVGLVHLKDVDDAVAAEVRAGRLTINGGVARGLFRPLGRGDVDIAGTIEVLEATGYAGWYVLEQDADLGPVAPPEGQGPLTDAVISADFVRGLVPGMPT